jgi:hypothetical protein
MEIAPVAFATLVVALAGPVGITLGWWLGRRATREQSTRDERKKAYVAYTSAAIRYRNADSDEKRREVRDERWAALSEVVLVAPPDVVQAAAYHIAAAEQLLEPGLTDDQRLAVHREIWDRHVRFTELARRDLGLGETNPFEGMRPVIAERVTFERENAAH